MKNSKMKYTMRSSESIKELHMKIKVFFKKKGVLRIFQWIKYSQWLR